MSAQIRVCLVVPGLSKAAGGPTAVVCGLAEALAEHGCEVSVFSVKSPDGSDCLPKAERVPSLLVEGARIEGLRVSWAKGFGEKLADHCRSVRVDILHNHGLWLPVNHACAATSRRLGLPLVTSTHGMLAPWALGHKAWKKRLAWWLYQKRDLVAARVLHATADQEARGLRAQGLRQPLAVIPNGIQFPPAAGSTSLFASDGERAGACPAKASSRRRMSCPAHSPLPARPSSTPPLQYSNTPTFPHTALFLGRIYPVKGLMNLIRAWAQVKPAGWRCVLAGPDEAGHRAELEREINALGLQEQFEFPGSLEDGAKWERYRSADVFVLPSFTENFGLAVAEALAAGVPAIATQGAPWQELATHRCGWWVEVGVAPLANALREATQLTDERRQEMGARGRSLVQAKYSWPQAAVAMTSVYRWILGKGGRPDGVWGEAS